VLVTDVREELARELEQQFAAVRTHPSWPDPWPDRRVPDEAYSRVTDPERWLLGPERGQAWARALTARGLATRVDVPGTIRLTPRAPGALPLTLVAHVPAVGAVDLNAALEVRVGAAEVLALEPDCHCDACDSGSADLLAEIDDVVWHVLEGDFTRIDLGGAAITTTRHGWSSSRSLGRDAIERLVADARAGRCRYPVVRGAAWW
jgi:hypothetical protein